MDEILGQSAAVDLLLDQLASGRPHHAYIFHGPTGVGKFTTAVALARILLCHRVETDLTGRPSACGSCDSCRLLAPSRPGDAQADAQADAQEQEHAIESAHPDLHVVAKELAAASSVATVRSRKQTNIPVDLLRELVVGGTTSDGHYHDAPAFKSPNLRHGKVFVIDEAELLDAPGQNVLLKTLEEPPAGTTLVLVTSSEDRLLPTIRSRCQRVAFTPLADEIVGGWIDEQGGDLADRARSWLIEFASGSLGRASLAIEYDLLAWARSVLPAIDRIAKGQAVPELGQTLSVAIKEFADSWVAKRAKGSKEAANKLAAQLMWSMIAGHVQRRMHQLAQACSPEDPIRSEAALDPWLSVIDALSEAERLLAANVNLTLVCDQLVAAMHESFAIAGSM